MFSSLFFFIPTEVIYQDFINFIMCYSTWPIISSYNSSPIDLLKLMRTPNNWHFFSIRILKKLCKDKMYRSSQQRLNFINAFWRKWVNCACLALFAVAEAVFRTRCINNKQGGLACWQNSENTKQQFNLALKY